MSSYPYYKNRYRTFIFRLPYMDLPLLIKHLEGQDNLTAYLIDLTVNDMIKKGVDVDEAFRTISD